MRRLICRFRALWSRRSWNTNPPSSGHDCDDPANGVLTCKTCGWSGGGWSAATLNHAEMLNRDVRIAEYEARNT